MISLRLPLNKVEKALFKKYKPTEQRNLSRFRAKNLQKFDHTKSIFVHIPKTAGMSLRQSIYASHLGYHTSLLSYFRAYPTDLYLNYFKFAFVRNPWDRLYSAYRYLSGKSCTEYDQKYWASTFGGISFPAFVLESVKNRGLPTYIHFNSQHSFLATSRFSRLSSPILGVNFLGLYENLADDYSIIAERLNLNSSLEKVNSSRGCDKRAYFDAYTPEMATVVSGVYKQDIDLFGYSFDNSTMPRQIWLRSVGRLG